MAFLSFILVLFPIVIIHEFGHFIIGKLLGAEPEEFAIGFGRAIYSFNYQGTLFKIGWIPLGGYVKFKKLQFDVEFGEGDKKGEKLPAGRWFWISVAGPVSNFILTSVILGSMIFTTMGELQSGKTSDGKTIVKVTESHPLLRKHFLNITQPGEYFISAENGFESYQPAESDKFAPVPLEKKALLALTIGPTFVVNGSIATIKALGDLVSTKEGYKNMMGPVGIAGVAEEARSEGMASILLIIASLSFAVGFFNLLPLAFLDGGRAVMAAYEGLTRRSISMRVLGLLNTISLVIVLNLLVVGLFSDFMRLFFK